MIWLLFWMSPLATYSGDSLRLRHIVRSVSQHASRLDDSASALAVQRASPDQLRELVTGLISGSRQMKRTLDHFGLEPSMVDAADPSSSSVPGPAPKDESKALANFEKDLEEELAKIPDERQPGPPHPPDFSSANSVSNRKEWMSFSRRLLLSDAAEKYPEICRLWEGSSTELRNTLVTVCFTLAGLKPSRCS